MHKIKKSQNFQRNFIFHFILFYFSNRLGSLFGYKPTQSNQHFNDTAHVPVPADCLSTNNETKKSE